MASQTNAERFIYAFSIIEKALNEITRRPRYIPFRLNARISARYNPIVKNYLEDICVFAELRNCIVHNRDGNKEIVAEPSDSLTEKIEHIAELLQKDHQVLSFATSPVITCDYNQPLKEAVAIMDEKNIHKLPVYSEGKFMGMFTLQQVLHRILSNPEDMGSVSDVLEASHKDRVMFVSRSARLEHIAQVFEDFAATGTREPAIIVTENGEIHEEPLGIITLHDLARITTFLA